MVESTETNQKDLLKNKRVLKGTPISRLASRYGLYFALSLGCMHVTIGWITYHADVDEFWLTGGQQQIADKALKLGLYKRKEDDIARYEMLKEDFRSTNGYALSAYLYEKFGDFKEKYFTKAPVDPVSQPSGTTTE